VYSSLEFTCLSNALRQTLSFTEGTKHYTVVTIMCIHNVFDKICDVSGGECSMGWEINTFSQVT
jgi:hypothetical protein